jgi:hypothetical protein
VSNCPPGTRTLGPICACSFSLRTQIAVCLFLWVSKCPPGTKARCDLSLPAGVRKLHSVCMMVGKAILVYGIGPVWHCTCAHVIVHLLALYLHGVACVALHVCARHCALTGTVLAWGCTCGIACVRTSLCTYWHCTCMALHLCTISQTGCLAIWCCCLAALWLTHRSTLAA